MSGRPTQRYERRQKTLQEVQKGSGGPSRGPGVVGRTSRMSGRGREPLPEVRRGLKAHAEVWEGSGGPF